MIPVLLFFWFVAIILLIVIYRSGKNKPKSKWNILLLLICTPIPGILYIVGGYIWFKNFEFKTTQKVYAKNGCIVKEVSYTYQKKKEYWSNVDSPNNFYLLDSVVYFDDKSKEYKTDIYKDWERLKGDTETAMHPALYK